MLKTKSIMLQFAEVVPEHLFVEITEKMEWFDAHVGSLESALEETPKVFESVGVDLSVNVAFGVVHDFVHESFFAQPLVGHERIGVDRASRLDVGFDVSMQAMLATVADDSRPNLTAPFEHADDCGLVFGASLSDPAFALIGVHEASSAADEGFVYLDFAARAAHLDERTSLHRKANPVQHEPCRLLSDAEGACHFVGTDSILAVRNHPNGDEPLVERQRGIFHDGPDLRGELPMAVDVLALPLALILQEHNVIATAGGADDFAVRPAEPDHELDAVIGVCEVKDGLLEGFGLVHVSHLNREYPKPSDLSSILLPLQVLILKGFSSDSSVMDS